MKTVIGYLPRKKAPSTESTKTTKTTVVTAAIIAIGGPELPSVQYIRIQLLNHGINEQTSMTQNRVKPLYTMEMYSLDCGTHVVASGCSANPMLQEQT